MQYYLRQLTPGDTNAKIRILLTEDRFIFGANSVHPQRYQKMSEKHASFHQSNDGKLFIKDENSKHGTYVNDTNIGTNLKQLTRGDIIGFGVNQKSTENGFLCVLEDSYNERNQSEPTEPEYIDLVTDDDDDVPKISAGFVKSINSTCPDKKTSDVADKNTSLLSCPSAAILTEDNNDSLEKIQERTFLQKHYFNKLQKKCFVPLIKCDSEDILKRSKKRPRRISSDSSNESCEEDSNNSSKISSNSFITKSVNKQKHFNNKDSNKRGVRRKKIARRINSDSFDETYDISPSFVHNKNQNSLSKQQSKTESSNAVFSEMFPSDSVTENFNKNAYLNKNDLSDSSKMLPELSSDSSSSSSIHDLNPLNDSNRENAKTFHYDSYQTNIQKNEVEERMFENSSNSITDTTVMGSRLVKDNYPNSLNETDTYSQTEVAINISDDDFFDFDHNKVESEDEDIKKEIFGSSDEEENFHLYAKSESSTGSQNIESIENIQKFVNTGLKDSLERKPSESKEINSKLSDSETSSEENLLPNKKNIFWGKSKFDIDKNSKSSSKIILIDPKQMTYRPRSKRGRDEGYVERKKPAVYPKRKRGRPMKEEIADNKIMNLDIPVRVANKPEKHPNHLNDLKMKSLSKGKYLAKTDRVTSGSSLNKSKNITSANKTLLTDSKSMQNPSLRDKGENEGNIEKQIFLNVISAKKKGRPSKYSQLEHESVEKNTQNTTLTDPKRTENDEGNIESQTFLDAHKSTENISVNDNHENKSLPISRDIKIPRKRSSSVKIRPEKFSSRGDFLINEDIIKPVRRDKKNKNHMPNAKKNDARQVKFQNTVSAVDLKKSEIVEKIVDPVNVVPGDEDLPSYPKSKSSNENQKIESIEATQEFDNNSVLRDSLDPKPCGSKELSAKCSDSRTETSSEVICYFENPEQNRSNSSHIFQVGNLQETIFHSSDSISRRKHTFTEDNQLPFELSILGIVKNLLQFNAKWLQEQCGHSKPPKEVLEHVASLPLNFASYNSYVSSLYPLILLDTWQYIFEESKKVLPNKRFPFRILSVDHKNDYTELKCETVSNEECFKPQQGMMTILEMKMNQQKSHRIFGFIFKHRVRPLNVNMLHVCWKKTSAESLKEAKHWTFHVWIKKRELRPKPGILMRGNGICYIRNKLNLVEALHCFKYSPLMKDIIKPTLSTCTLICSDSAPNRRYTSHQMKIIKAVCSEIGKPYPEKKIALIHGPPGTGKTHAIIGILEHLFYIDKHDSNLKVLVTAPSNVAIDEIGCRLIELSKQYGSEDSGVKFVRIGQKLHPKMIPYDIDQKADKSVQLQKLCLEISNVEKQPDSLNKTRKLETLRNQYNYIKDYKIKIKYKRNVLKESKIILTTLSSCSLSILSRTFQSNSEMKIACCIVDESTQCTEPEILQPLALGITKLILVGDDKQLPAALPEYSKEYKFNQSMFERFCSYFESYQPSPVLSLTEQFRMHSSICEFPSTCMYDKLSTHPDTDLRYEEFPLKPYFILNVAQSDSFSESVKNCEILISGICEFLSGIIEPSTSIGIIVPPEFHHFLRNLHTPCTDAEIKTVNGFQGREKDVIVLCAFKPKFNSATQSFISCEREFNVALTRAKKCLIICTDTSTLMGYPHWKKLILNAKERQNYFFSPSPRDFPKTLKKFALKRS